MTFANDGPFSSPACFILATSPPSPSQPVSEHHYPSFDPTCIWATSPANWAPSVDDLKHIYPSPPNTDSDPKHTVPLPILFEDSPSHVEGTSACPCSGTLAPPFPLIQASEGLLMSHPSTQDLPLSPPPSLPMVPCALPETTISCHPLDRFVDARDDANVEPDTTDTESQLLSFPDEPPSDLLTPLSPIWDLPLDDYERPAGILEVSALFSRPLVSSPSRLPAPGVQATEGDRMTLPCGSNPLDEALRGDKSAPEHRHGGRKEMRDAHERITSMNDERVSSILDYPPPPWGRRAPLPSRIQPPPDKLHPTLSSWLKNIDKLDSLINHLQELAYSAPTDHRSQLSNKVAVLRAMLKKQQERCIEFLQLSEDYAYKYLLDIDAEIRQQSTLLDNLEERLEAAKKLHRDALDLQMLYESRTVASMNDLCATGISRPLPEDNALFKEIDFVMAEIRRFYEELNKFWREEICYVVEALKKRRVDPRDFERWNSFRSSLNQTIEFWRYRPPSGDVQTLPSNNTSSSTGVDLGAITSSLSSNSDSFREALERVSSSASLRYSPLSRPSFQRAYVAFAANSDLCLSFLRHCADYAEKVFTWCNSFNASPIPSRMGAPHDLRERTASLLSEMTVISTENVASVEGSQRYKATYKKAWALEQKTTSELYTLLENLSSWAAVIDGPSGDALIDEVRPQELGELKCAWEKTRDSLRSALETLTSEPVHHNRSSQAFMRCRSALRRWMTSIVSFS